jgi:hypothetical protein
MEVEMGKEMITRLKLAAGNLLGSNSCILALKATKMHLGIREHNIF